MKKFIKFFLACFSMFVIFNIMQTKTYAAGGMLGGKYCNYEVNQIYLEGDYVHVKGWFYRVYEHYTSSNHNYYVKVHSGNAYIGSYWDLNDYYVDHTELQYVAGDDTKYNYKDVGFHFKIPVKDMLNAGYASYKLEVHITKDGWDLGKDVSYMSKDTTIKNEGYTMSFKGSGAISGFYIDSVRAYVRTGPSKTASIVKHSNGKNLFWTEYDGFKYSDGSIVDSSFDNANKVTWYKARIVDGGSDKIDGVTRWRARKSTTSSKTGWASGSFIEYVSDDFYISISRNTHIFSFNANGGSGAPGNQTKYYGLPFTFPSTVPVRDGYRFTGWTEDKNGSGTVYQPNQWVGDFTDTDKTFYAQWKNYPPELIIPVLPDETPDVPSNIPPFIADDMVIVQKGDPVDPTDYVEVNDKEDGDISDRVVIEKNPIPYDKNGNTTEAGIYDVIVSVTDNGGSKVKATVTILVNDKPLIEAGDRYFYKNAEVGKKEILKQAKSLDYEDGDISDKIIIVSIKDKDGNELAKDRIDTSKVAFFKVTYKITDKYKASNTCTALFTVLDKDVAVEGYSSMRYISKKYLGTLDPESNWKKNASLYNQLNTTLNKEANDSNALYVIEFNAKKSEEMKEYIVNSTQDQDFNGSFLNRFGDIFKKKPSDGSSRKN